MRHLFILLLVFTFAACTPRSVGSNGQTPTGAPSNNSGASRSEGGVDVGNMNSSLVPETNASMTYPSAWTGSITGQSLEIKNKDSQIEAQRADIKDLASPSAISLKGYLKDKYPKRDYKVISVHGLEGVRADLIDRSDAKQSDIYLVSELKDFIHIRSDLNGESGVREGEKILLTVRVKYAGIAYPNAQIKTADLKAYSRADESRMRAAYSLLSDCYSYVDSNCRGVAILFGNGTGSESLNVGAGGYDHGRIIDLGPESEVPFESVKVDGQYLIAPQTSIPLSDIYTAFTPKDRHREQDKIQLQKGHVYLIRTVSWPDEDLISKVRVDQVQAGVGATLTYQKLVYVEPQTLQTQVDQINKYTTDFEQPITDGEVTLFNRSVWGNYFFASFNFAYSTSGNMYITRNGWDLTYDGNFSVPYTGSALGQVVDLGVRDLSSIQITDAPNPNLFDSRFRVEPQPGHSYIVYHYDYDGTVTYGAIRVLEISPGKEWARLRFRRLDIRPVNHFQDWIDLQTPPGVSSISLLSNGSSGTNIWLPFINKRGDQGRHYYESVDFGAGGSGDVLRADSRPFGNERGFAEIIKGASFETMTLAQVESQRGQFDSRVSLKLGGVYSVLLENYYDKTVAVIRVDAYTPGKSVQLSVRYLYRGKTAYSDDKD